ncbi:aladin-like [Lutzomyia longipalpis]|uniref:aladin-like n=1 Tax=Lutzomyia longipalpis TaxID=7200 RepID=UPI0024835464|nr:aladin-like [Lutzomyia longipalpis]
MVSLQNFSVPPASGEISICEQQGRICSLPITEVDIGRGIPSGVCAKYPEINIVRELFHTSSSNILHRDSGRNLMMPVHENLLKHITRTFFEDSLSAALEEASTASSAVVRTCAKYLLYVVNVGNNMRYFLRPHLRDQTLASVGKFSETKNWHRSPIRCIKWHPHCFKLAVAASDDSIRVFTDEPTAVPVLKTGLQKGITSMAWRPFTAGLLAVGCQSGVLLWSLEPNSHITRPLSQATHLKSPNHTPVTSVHWSPNGCLLVTASINDANIIIWDVDQNRSTALRRLGPPCTHVKWSPDGCRLFSATMGNVFRVWNANKWTPERWTVGVGTIQSLAWSPCGTHLVFVTTEETCLYALHFVEEQVFNSTSLPKQALRVADLARTNVGGVEVGGRPQQVAWCPTGEHLAVSFRDTSVISIFSTSISKHNFSISPSCFLNGLPEEFPTYLCFQPKGKQADNSVLTIGWSSGRIQYFPFL